MFKLTIKHKLFNTVDRWVFDYVKPELAKERFILLKFFTKNGKAVKSLVKGTDYCYHEKNGNLEYSWDLVETNQQYDNIEHVLEEGFEIELELPNSENARRPNIRTFILTDEKTKTVYNWRSDSYIAHHNISLQNAIYQIIDLVNNGHKVKYYRP